MAKIGKNVITALMVGILIAGVAGCEKKEGPMERTGKEIDKAAKKAGQQIDRAVDKAGEKIKHSVK